MALEIIQISDTHLCEDHPSRLQDLQRCITAISQEPQPPAFLVHTGDITHNGLESEYDAAMQAMNSLGLPVYVLPGNRDNRAVMLEFFKDSGYLPADSEFFQYAIESYDTRVVVLDTHCPFTHKGELCAKRFAHFEAMLSVNKEKPVVVAMHHAPFEASEIPDPFQFADWSQVDHFHKVVSEHDSITRVICGHVHRNIEVTIGDTPVQALTCLAGDLRKGDVTDQERLEPVFRWHRFQA